MARPDHDDVLAHRGHLFVLTAAESFAESDQQQQRSHTPGDAKHREERAQFMRPQRAHSLAEDVQQQLHVVHGVRANTYLSSKLSLY